MGKPVVMGRKTFLLDRQAAPGRTNIVVSRDPRFRGAGRGGRAEPRRRACRRPRRRAAARRGRDRGHRRRRNLRPDACRLPTGSSSPGARCAAGDAYFPAIDPARLARDRARASMRRAEATKRFRLRHLCVERRWRPNAETFSPAARCAARRARVVRRALPYNPPANGRRHAPARQERFDAVEQSGRRPLGFGGRRGPGARVRSRPGRRRPTSKNSCAAARTGCAACCRAAISAAAASR